MQNSVAGSCGKEGDHGEGGFSDIEKLMPESDDDLPELPSKPKRAKAVAKGKGRKGKDENDSFSAFRKVTQSHRCCTSVTCTSCATTCDPEAISLRVIKSRLWIRKLEI